MSWFSELRQDYIDWSLLNVGSIKSVDIAEAFDVSLSQASIDIKAFTVAHPNVIEYDTKHKMYCPVNAIYAPQRGAKDGPMVVVIAEIVP